MAECLLQMYTLLLIFANQTHIICQQYLEVCDNLLPLLQDVSRQKTLEIATSLLTLATPTSVQQHTKSLMASLFANTQIYHSHKVSLLGVIEESCIV